MRLNPGDMISVDPEAMIILQPPPNDSVLDGIEDILGVEDLAGKGEQAKPTEALKTETPIADEAEKPRMSKAETLRMKEQDPSNPPFTLRPYAAPWIFVPPYLEISFPTCSAVYLRHPTARPGYSEIASPYDADGEIFRFGWEWYRKNAIRPRGWKRKLRDIMEKGKSGWSGVPR